MTPTEKQTEWTNEKDLRFLLGLSNKRLSDVTKALERNWTIQLILAGIGVALVFDIGDLPKFLSRYASQDAYDLKPAAAIILAVLLYHFMKFGHLLTAFVESHRLTDSLLQQHLGEDIQTKDFQPLQETTSYFEGYYSANAFGGRGRPVMTLYYFLSAAVIAISQAAALTLIVKAYGVNGWSIGTITVVAGIIGVLYRAFWRSNKDLPGTTLLVLASSLTAVALFFVFSAIPLREAVHQAVLLTPTTAASVSKKVVPPGLKQNAVASLSKPSN